MTTKRKWQNATESLPAQPEQDERCPECMWLIGYGHHASCSSSKPVESLPAKDKETCQSCFSGVPSVNKNGICEKCVEYLANFKMNIAKPVCATCGEPIYQRDEFGDKAWYHTIGGEVFAQEIRADVPEHVWDEFGLGKVEPLPVEAKDSVCCFITCNKAATWQAWDGPQHDDYTEACDTHLGHLLSDKPEHRVWPLTTTEPKPTPSAPAEPTDVQKQMEHDLDLITAFAEAAEASLAEAHTKIKDLELQLNLKEGTD